MFGYERINSKESENEKSIEEKQKQIEIVIHQWIFIYNLFWVIEKKQENTL